MSNPPPITCCGHAATGPDGQGHEDTSLRWTQIAPVAVCGSLIVLGYLTRWAGYPDHGLFIGAAIAGGWPTARSTFYSLWVQHRLNVDFLMLTGAIGAAAVGHIDEAAILLFLFALAEMLEAFAMGRTRRALKSLMQLRPDEATVQRDGQLSTVPLNEIAVGEIIAVRPGERIPLDGTLLSGSADIDESALTGESLPLFKEPGDTLLAGSINLSGALRITTVRPAGESTLDRIVQLVEQARGSQAHTQRLLNRYVVFYVVLVLASALLAGLIPPLVWGSAWEPAIYRAMTLLVVASPCALVISTPATILSAIAAAARRGILFKGGAAVEALGQANVIAFDKTGTLTDGHLAVTEIITSGNRSEDEVLTLAAAAESGSEHPLARAIVRAAEERGLPIPIAKDFHTTAGLGISASVEGVSVVIGSRRFLQSQGVETSAESESSPSNSDPSSAQHENTATSTLQKTTQGKVIHVVADGVTIGQIILADQLRPEAAAAVKKLKQLGIRELVMLTGDEPHAAAAMAQGAGITKYYASLLPEEKVDKLRELSANKQHVVMVGDGVNDAPALATADVGVAMGAAGTDLAIESADVVLMSSHLGQLVEAVALSQHARRVLQQNLLFASAVIVVLISITLFGNLAISLGVVGHEGSTLIVVFNGLRLLLARRTSLE